MEMRCGREACAILCDLPCGWKRHRYASADSSRPIGHFDRRVVALRDLAHDRESQPAAFGGHVVEAAEALEDARALRPGNALAVIGDREHRTLPAAPRGDRHGARAVARG